VGAVDLAVGIVVGDFDFVDGGKLSDRILQLIDDDFGEVPLNDLIDPSFLSAILLDLLFTESL
jgi:hypothetical protein